MKRFLSMIVVVCAFFAVSAQYPLVSLSHNGELSFFDNLYAFESAYNAAENGDTIFLSKGEFVLNGGAFTIEKRLNIVGNGYDSHLLGSILVSIGSGNSFMDAPLFDGLRLDRLDFNSTSTARDNLYSAKIVRCQIDELHGGAQASRNMTFDKCKIGLKNGIIGFGGSGEVTVINSILVGNGNIYNPENQPLLVDGQCPLNLKELGYLGQDGTVVGIYGGESPFSESPSVPSVDTEKSSVDYDAENNKLKVSITVKAD